MKKLLLVLLLLCSLTFCFACEKDGRGNDKDAQNNSQTGLPDTENTSGLVLPEDVFE